MPKPPSLLHHHDAEALSAAYRCLARIIGKELASLRRKAELCRKSHLPETRDRARFFGAIADTIGELAEDLRMEDEARDPHTGLHTGGGA